MAQATTETKYEVHQVDDDTGRVDWRPTRDEAESLRAELDTDTENKHEVIAVRKA